MGDGLGVVVPNPEGDPGGSSGSGGTGTPGATGAAGAGSAGAKGKKSSTKAHPSNDPKSVRKKLSSFKVKGTGRDKIATLLNEIRTLKLETHPHAFCFLLRSLIELSAKAYCVDHKKIGGPDPKKGRVVPEVAMESIREVLLKPYRIVYRALDEQRAVEIIRISHAARGTPKI